MYLVCDFERENHRSDICVCDFCVYVCDRVWICVCVCDFGPKNKKSKFVFLILGLAGHKGTGPAGAQRGGFGVEKKIRLINGPGPGFQGRPTGRVRVWKNPTQTRHVAIPTSSVMLHENLLTLQQKFLLRCLIATKVFVTIELDELDDLVLKALHGWPLATKFMLQ